MSVLAVNDDLDFSTLKVYLDVTDGNLATHLKKLEKLNFVESEKSFIDNKPNTRYFMTSKGKKAFNEHLKVLETIIKSNK